MCGKGEYTSLTPSLDEERLVDSMASFEACKNYDERISVIHRSKYYGLYTEQLPQQQIKNGKAAKRVLLVDDDHDINLTLRLVLEDSGFKVDSFTNALLALASFRPGLYDLAILDIKMPVMNGFGLYQEIRKLDNNVKICFLTAATDVYYEAFRKEAFPNLDDNCVSRMPIENELLIKQIMSIIC